MAPSATNNQLTATIVKNEEHLEGSKSPFTGSADLVNENWTKVIIIGDVIILK